MQNIYLIFLMSVLSLFMPAGSSAQTANEEVQTEMLDQEIADVVPPVPVEAAPVPQPKALDVDIQALQILLNDEHSNGVDWEAIVSDYAGSPFDGQKASALDVGILTSEDFAVLLDALNLVGVNKSIFNERNTLDLDAPLNIAVKPLEIFDVSGDVSPNAAKGRLEKVKITLNAQRSVEENKFQMTVDPQVLLSANTGMVPSPYVESSRLERVGTTIRSFIPFAENDKVRDARNERVDESGLIYNMKASEDSSAVFTTTAIKPKMDVTLGSTFVLGGIFKEVVMESTRKVPLLGDIPMLGFVFRNEGQQIRKSEIIIFITPKSVSSYVE